jgi:hypothetical protein
VSTHGNVQPKSRAARQVRNGFAATTYGSMLSPSPMNELQRVFHNECCSLFADEPSKDEYAMRTHVPLNSVM